MCACQQGGHRAFAMQYARSYIDRGLPWDERPPTSQVERKKSSWQKPRGRRFGSPLVDRSRTALPKASQRSDELGEDAIGPHGIRNARARRSWMWLLWPRVSAIARLLRRRQSPLELALDQGRRVRESRSQLALEDDDGSGPGVDNVQGARENKSTHLRAEKGASVLNLATALLTSVTDVEWYARCWRTHSGSR